MPIPAAQLPAVFILAALRVLHLVYSETFLEVLGADLGVQDLFCHGTGEPTSLLVMQPLTEDPPYKEVRRVGSSMGAGEGKARPSS